MLIVFLGDAVKSDDLDFHLGHRERLRQKFLDNKLADYEKLELLLGFVIPRRDVRPLARGLLAKFGGISQILTAPIEKLTEYKGIGKNTAIFIKLIHSIMISGYKAHLDETPAFHDDKILANYCKLLLSGKNVEEFHVLYFDSRMHLLADDLHSVGTIDWTAVYPREIVKRALDVNAKYVLLLHNHPTPNTSFSSDDIRLTTQVQEVLKPLDIDLYDHYVVSGGIVYSARNLFLLK